MVMVIVVVEVLTLWVAFLFANKTTGREVFGNRGVGDAKKVGALGDVCIAWCDDVMIR